MIQQVVGRVVRLGQTRPVTIQILLVEGTQDEAMHKLVEEKSVSRADKVATASCAYCCDWGRICGLL
jgi:hypothetical protein